MSSLFCFYLSLCLLTLFVGFFVAFLLCCMLYVCFWLACFVLFVLFVYSPCFLVYLQFVLLWLFLCMSFFWKRQLFLFPSVAFTIIFVCLFICSLSTLIVHFVDQKIWSSLPFVILGPDKLATGGNPRPIKSKHAAWIQIQIRKRALAQIRYMNTNTNICALVDTLNFILDAVGKNLKYRQRWYKQWFGAVNAKKKEKKISLPTIKHTMQYHAIPCNTMHH